MAVTETIQELLQGIDDAQYGREMRQFIHKGIQKCYEEGSAGETDLPARESIEKILEIFGDVESTSTASKAYSIGDSVVYDGRLYKVITAINQGDTLTVGTNIEETKAVSNISDIYELPFEHTGNSRLFIIPAIKLMILHISEPNVAMTTTHLPILWGFNGSLYSGTARTVVVAQKTGETDCFGVLTVQASSSDLDDSYISINVPGAGSSGWTVRGTLVAPYYRLNSNHPFSEATPLTWGS